ARRSFDDHGTLPVVSMSNTTGSATEPRLVRLEVCADAVGQRGRRDVTAEQEEVTARASQPANVPAALLRRHLLPAGDVLVVCHELRRLVILDRAAPPLALEHG